MIKNMFFAVCAIIATSAIVMTACTQAEESVANEPTDQVGPQTRTTDLANFRRVAYVEINDVNPLNVGEYYLSDGVTPFFTDVILFASNIRGDANGNVHNYNNPNNAWVLDHPETFIAPLQAKGIRVIMGNLCDHTGAGFANLTTTQINTYVADLLTYAVDGYDFDDEWADYGQHGYPIANNTSYSNLLIALNAATERQISVFDYNRSYTLSTAAAECVDFASNSSLNGYSTLPNFSIPLARYSPYLCNLTNAQSDAMVKARVTSSKNANAGGVTFFNVPMNPTVLSKFNAAAQAFFETCSHTGVTYTKTYGNN